MSESRRAPGKIVAGRYHLERRLAEGGIGEVWLAEHQHLRQDVAIKFLKEELIADPEASRDILARFRLESQVSALLGRKTAHVVNVYDAGDSEVGPFLAMEYVSGRSLADELEAHGPMQPARLAIVLDHVAHALGVAHSLGIVHRDIKPANLLASEGSGGSLFIKLADFGIAKTTTLELPLDRPKDTSAMTMMGTPDFMSPEQLQGSKVHLTMDVWALGVAAYELLTGALPFEGKSKIDRIIKIMNDPFTPPSSRLPSLPAALDGWFARALAKDPSDRFASAREMSAAYRAAIGFSAMSPAEPLVSAAVSSRVASSGLVSSNAVTVKVSAREAAMSEPTISSLAIPGPVRLEAAIPGAAIPGPPSLEAVMPGAAIPGSPRLEVAISEPPRFAAAVSEPPRFAVAVSEPPRFEAAISEPPRFEAAISGPVLSAEPARSRGRRRAVLAAVALAALLAGGLLLARASRDPAPDKAATPVTPEPPGTAQAGIQPVVAEPTGRQPVGVSPVPTAPDVSPVPGPPSALPTDPARSQRPKTQPAGALSAPSAPTNTPPPSAPVPAPSVPPTPSGTAPKKVNPSTVL